MTNINWVQDDLALGTAMMALILRSRCTDKSRYRAAMAMKMIKKREDRPPYRHQKQDFLRLVVVMMFCTH
jgi:hypothetical protein